VNRNAAREERSEIRFDGCEPRRVHRATLTGDSPSSANTPAEPEQVRVRRSEGEAGGARLEEVFPPHSYTLLTYEL
jgi:hypothetical protein